MPAPSADPSPRYVVVASGRDVEVHAGPPDHATWAATSGFSSVAPATTGARGSASYRRTWIPQHHQLPAMTAVAVNQKGWCLSRARSGEMDDQLVSEPGVDALADHVGAAHHDDVLVAGRCLEDDSDGFAHGGWSVNYWDEQMGQVMDEAMSRPFDLVLGRKTYDIFAAYWPHAPEDAGAKPLNDATSTSRRGVVPGWSGASQF